MVIKQLKRTIAILMALVLMMSQCLVFADSTNSVTTRSQADNKYKWDLKKLYADEKAWAKDCEKIEKELIPAVQKFKGKLNSPTQVLECIKAIENMSSALDKVYWYAQFRSDLNNADSAASELSSKAAAIDSKASEAKAFFNPEILSLSEKTLKDYIADKSLKDYKYYLTSLLNQKSHTLSKSEEELIGKFSEIIGAPKGIYEKLTDADVAKMQPIIKGDDGKDIKLSKSNYSALLENKNREVRKQAFENHFATYKKVENTLAKTMEAQVKKDVILAKARKYNSALEAAMLQDNLPVSVYDNLVKSVNNNVGYLHKYVELRKKVLGLDNVHLYDMYVPLVDDYEMKIPYEDAKKMVMEGLKPLGSEYQGMLKTAFDNNWIDVYPDETKTPGGYNLSAYSFHPHILLNYNNTLDEALTVGHELGHAMHGYYSCKNQNYTQSDKPKFTAETASTTNELICLEYLIKNAKSNKEKLFLINSYVENIRGSVYTQVMYAEFEKTIHDMVEKGEALSLDTLNSIWKGLMEKYYGKEFVVDDLASMWWSRIPHFYKNFYVYNYATGIAAAYPLSKAVCSGDKAAVDKYMTFLKAGGSDYPVEILKNAGVDMTTTKPVDELLTEFNRLVGEMEKLLKAEGKIK